MTLTEKITWIKIQSWDYETFETANDTIVLQAWPWSRVMHEWEFTLDGSAQIGEERIYTVF